VEVEAAGKAMDSHTDKQRREETVKIVCRAL
jgi:hypothetical protein